MTKEEIALELALQMLDNFSYDVQEYGGTSIEEHATISAKIAYSVYNDVYNNLVLA